MSTAFQSLGVHHLTGLEAPIDESDEYLTSALVRDLAGRFEVAGQVFLLASTLLCYNSSA
jgi:hypothetical protein